MLIKNKNHYFKFAPHVRYLEPSHDVFAGGGGRVECFGITWFFSSPSFVFFAFVKEL